MKHVLLASVIALLVISCSNNKAGEVKRKPDRIDTTIGIYVIAFDKRTSSPIVNSGRLIRAIKDTFRIVDGKVESYFDTTYYVMVADTLRDEHTKLPKLDSLGKVQFQEGYGSLSKKYVLEDYNRKF